MQTIIVTGGAGFIGCNFVRHLLDNTDAQVIVADKLTYAGSLHNLEAIADNPRYRFEQIDIADLLAVKKLIYQYSPNSIVNFAAETHVDRSIESPAAFVETNVTGTFVLLENALKYFNKLTEHGKREFRFLHVSTDEVYGTLGDTGLFEETTPYSPNSPYSASKAAADHFVGAYYETYGLPTVITNCSNNYGPYQFPEKLIPLMLLNALDGKELPIYGDGKNVRDWLYVGDHCDGIYKVLMKGRLGEKYNIGGNNEKTNVEIIDILCNLLEKLSPAASNPKLSEKGIKAYSELKTFVSDRPGHDRRYAIDSTKIQKELGWSPAHNLETGLESTIKWYLDNGEWCGKIQEDNYARERLGLNHEDAQNKAG